MEYAIFFIAAAVGLLIPALNPAILLSRAVYGKDIRELGSKNPGFTNFKRCFGPKLAWLVMVLDLLKSALPCFVFGILFERILADRALGVAFTCLFSVIGHSYPVWYGFKGGKGFLVSLAGMWIMHPLAGLAATLVMSVLLLTTKYMSLSSLSGLMAGLTVIFFVTEGEFLPNLLFILSVFLVVLRHRGNIARLLTKKEIKFYIFGNKNKVGHLDTDEKT